MVSERVKAPTRTEDGEIIIGAYVDEKCEACMRFKAFQGPTFKMPSISLWPIFYGAILESNGFMKTARWKSQNFLEGLTAMRYALA